MSKPRKQRRAQTRAVHSRLILHENAAGIDIGATSIYAAVPADRDTQPVRSFQTFTEDLHRLTDWLQHCGIETVAMESTGVFWIPLFQILEERGFEVYLVNARHVKNVPGRKTDVSDCQWLQYLHSVGLLQASFHPAQQVCALRCLLRHRDSLVQMASAYAQRIQKALDQMNLQLHHVISDITGVSGVAILDAILNGERDPLKLARLRDDRIKASEETVAKSLVGDYRSEHLFTLRQSLEAWRYHRKLIADCDDEVQRYLAGFSSKIDPKQRPLPPRKKTSSSKLHSSCSGYDLRTEHYRILGVDLTEVPSINTLTVHSVLAEVGPDLSKFRSAAALHPGWAYVPITVSAAGRCFPCALAMCRTAQHSLFVSPPKLASQPIRTRSLLSAHAR
jgi:hypothetical protein